MSDKTIRVELTEDEARAAAKVLNEDSPYNVHSGAAADKIRAALPPEYAEGTVAWVTTAERRHLAVRHDGAWVSSFDADDEAAPARWIDPNLSVKVEPLRVLADDEIAVPGPGHLYLRAAADLLERRNFKSTAEWIRSVADVSDAESRP